MKPTKQQIERWLEKCGYDTQLHIIMFRYPDDSCALYMHDYPVWTGYGGSYFPLRIFTKDGSKQVGVDFKLPTKREMVAEIIDMAGLTITRSTAVDLILKELEVEE